MTRLAAWVKRTTEPDNRGSLRGWGIIALVAIGCVALILLFPDEFARPVPTW